MASRARVLAAALACLVCAACAPTANSLYMHLGEGEQKCFIEEVPDDTVVMVKYKVQGFNPETKVYQPPAAGVGMHVIVKDPSKDILMQKDFQAEGQIVFTSHEAGEHVICLSTNTTRWFGNNQLRVHINIAVGEGANDYEEIAKEEKLSELQLRIRQLIDQSKMIQKEQAYQRAREARFRETSESTNARVLWWSIVQTAILVVTGYWQIRHLRGFFEAKKLV